jgi:hypothetical protein
MGRSRRLADRFQAGLTMKRITKYSINLGIMGLATCIGLFLCELGARIFLNPADFLSQDPVPDEILGAVLATKGNGYDEWGFRNKRIPTSVELVAIGDSHTFGNCAKMNESWPYVVGRIRGVSVYNMGLGGYGPNQYYHLLKTKALPLKPKTVVCGLYLGDDFENAFRVTYGLEYWSYLRELPADVSANANIWERQPQSGWNRKLRTWLSRHSVVYKLVFHGPLLGRIKGNFQIENASRLYDSTATLIIKEKNITEAFLPKGILQRLDQEKEGVREGMRITFRLLKEMDQLCREQNVQFIVAIIPTKETVFSNYLEHDSKQPLRDVIDRLIANERTAREKLFNFLRESDIRYVDTLPALQGSVENELYARTAVDIHPNHNGYKVIAEAISSALQTRHATQMSGSRQ